MNVAIGSDHAAYELKRELCGELTARQVTFTDVGTHGTDPVDYPDIAEAVCKIVVGGEVGRGILLCGSGVGVCVTANKFKGIRAGLCHDTYSAHQGVEHDDMNVLVLGARIIGVELAKEIVFSFLGARYTNEERHARRMQKLLAIESKSMRP